MVHHGFLVNGFRELNGSLTMSMVISGTEKNGGTVPYMLGMSSPPKKHLDRLKDSLSLHGRSQDLPPIGAIGRGARPSQCKLLRASAEISAPSPGAICGSVGNQGRSLENWKRSHGDPWEVF